MKSRATLRFFLLGCSLISTFTAHADTLTWSNGASTGNWNATDLNWTGDIWDNAAPDDAIFGATGVGTVTLTQATAAGSITFNTAGFTINSSTFGLTLNTGITANESATIQSGVGGSILLGADNAWSVASAKTLTVSSPISGASFGITKSGAGTLALSGPNTYGGDTTISAGVVNISNATSFGAGDVLVTGASRINVTGGISYANAINAGAELTLQNLTTTANNIAEFSGVLSGAGTINIANSSSGNNQTNLFFSNANNTFTGNIVGAAGNANGADYFRFNSIGDGGNFTFNKSGNRGGVTYSGSSDIEFNTRQIALGTSFGGGGTYGVNGNGIPQNSFQNNATNAAHTVTFKTNMAMTSIASSSVFHFDGSNTGNNTFAGNIGDPTGANTLGIGKWGTGKWILTGSNSYEGNTFITNGTLAVNTIDVAANNQALGKGSLIHFGYNANSGTLEFTGSTNSSTDKQIVIGNNNNNHAGGAMILNNGDGTMSFSNTTFNSLPGTVTTVDRALALGGTNTGANTISGTIRDNVAGAAQVSLTKADAGRWVLSGNNTYTGTTTINGGVLVADHANAVPGGLLVGGTGSAISLNGGILGLSEGDFTRLPNGSTIAAGRITFTGNGGFAAYGSNRIVNFGGASGIVAIGSTTTSNIGSLNGKTLILGASTATHKVTVTNTLDFGNASRTIQVDDGLADVDAEISGILQPQSGGTAGLNKTGDGTLLLSSASNTLNGETNVTAGTLIVNGNISTSVLTTVSTGATLGGTGTVGAATINGILAPGNSIGTLTATGDVTWNDNDAWVFELGSAASTLALANTTPGLSDLLDITGGNDFLKGTGSSFTFDFAAGGMAGWYKLVDWTGTTDFVLTDFLATNLGTGLTGEFTVDGGTSALYLNVIPEPRAALLGGLGMLMLLRRRR